MKAIFKMYFILGLFTLGCAKTPASNIGEDDNTNTTTGEWKEVNHSWVKPLFEAYVE